MRTNGFTMLELLVTLAVATILITIAIPSFMHMIASNQRQTIVANVIRAVNHARSEAITRNVNVQLCGGSDNCTNAPSSWNDGWVIYVPASDKVLQKHGAVNGQFALKITTFPNNTITFRPSGRPEDTGSLILCHSGQSAISAREIAISFAGHPHASEYTGAECGN